MFESLVWKALTGFKRTQPVYVEAESRKIGALSVPEALIEAMRASDCVLLEAPVAARLRLLKDEYAHFLEHADALIGRLECLAPIHGHAVIEKWKELALARRWDRLIVDLLARHYDPAYTRSIAKHYPALDRARKLELGDTGDAAFQALAQRCLESESTRERV